MLLCFHVVNVAPPNSANPGIFKPESGVTRESEGSFEYGNYWREDEDLRAVIEHFNGKNCVVTAILGHSKGGDVVLLYASKYHNVHTVVNLSACYHLQRGMDSRLGKNFWRESRRMGSSMEQLNQTDNYNLRTLIPYRSLLACRLKKKCT